MPSIHDSLQYRLHQSGFDRNFLVASPKCTSETTCADSNTKLKRCCPPAGGPIDCASHSNSWQQITHKNDKKTGVAEKRQSPKCKLLGFLAMGAYSRSTDRSKIQLARISSTRVTPNAAAPPRQDWCVPCINNFA